MKRWARLSALGALLAAGAAAGCGQQGPLVLPEDARAVERVDAPAGEADQTDDEQQDER